MENVNKCIKVAQSIFSKLVVEIWYHKKVNIFNIFSYNP